MFGIGVDDRRITTMARFYGGEFRVVEARNQMGDGIPAALPGGFDRVGVALPIVDGEQGFGTGDMYGGFGPIPQAIRNSQSRSWSVSSLSGSFCRRVIGEPPERIVKLVAYSAFVRMAASMTNNPLYRHSRPVWRRRSLRFRCPVWTVRFYLVRFLHTWPMFLR